MSNLLEQQSRPAPHKSVLNIELLNLSIHWDLTLGRNIKSNFLIHEEICFRPLLTYGGKAVFISIVGRSPGGGCSRPPFCSFPLPLIGSNDPHYCSSNRFIIQQALHPSTHYTPLYCRFDSTQTMSSLSRPHSRNHLILCWALISLHGNSI